jgi:hypothetical protein
VGALLVAIVSSKKASVVAEKSLSEAAKTRMDDSMPILERTPLLERQNTGEMFEFTLTNVGKGRLFNLRIEPEDSNVSLFHELKNSTSYYEKLYKVKLDIGRIGKDKKFDLEYRYEDIYGRTFRAMHNLIVDNDGGVPINCDVSMPEFVEKHLT